MNICVLCTLEITDWISLTKTNGYFWATFIPSMHLNILVTNANGLKVYIGTFSDSQENWGYTLDVSLSQRLSIDLWVQNLLQWTTP